MITDFVLANWSDVLIIFTASLLAIIPFFPPTWGGANKTYYDILKKEDVIQKKFNLVELIIRLLGGVILTGFSVSIGFRGTITLVLLVVLITDLIFNKAITNNAITVSIVAIIALYLESILDKAEEVSFGKVFHWKTKSYVQTNKDIPNDFPKQTELKK